MDWLKITKSSDEPRSLLFRTVAKSAGGRRKKKWCQQIFRLLDDCLSLKSWAQVQNQGIIGELTLFSAPMWYRNSQKTTWTVQDMSHGLSLMTRMWRWWKSEGRWDRTPSWRWTHQKNIGRRLKRITHTRLDTNPINGDPPFTSKMLKSVSWCTTTRTRTAEPEALKPTSDACFRGPQRSLALAVKLSANVSRKRLRSSR